MRGHFFHPSLLASQFAALEAPPAPGEDLLMMVQVKAAPVEDMVSLIIEGTKQTLIKQQKEVR
jgi:gluconate kinase